jgi:hypothetical protein
VRVSSNREIGAYEVVVARDALADPDWEEATQGLKFWQLIKIAFGKYLIETADHSVVKRLRGIAG